MKKLLASLALGLGLLMGAHAVMAQAPAAAKYNEIKNQTTDS